MFNVETHGQYDSNLPADPIVTTEIKDILFERRKALQRRLESLPLDAELTEEENKWLARSYPVLAILAPVMSTHEEKIEFPGDPMCLYGALSVAVDQAVQARASGLGEGSSPYNDLCPRWGEYPSPQYRRTVSESGIRQYDGRLLNTDQTVFDPRVWNDKIREYFVRSVLMKIKPKVILISAVSPAHRYALDIVRTIRRVLPDCIIVLGGRHTDETIHYDTETGQVEFAPTSAFHKMYEGDIGQMIDFAIAGQGYYALDLLMKAISLAMDIETKSARVSDVVRILSDFAPVFGQPAGYALIAAMDKDLVHVWVLTGPKLNLRELPSPYRAFAIRASFPIFERNGRVLRTAHFMVTNACPYHCFFCSEGATVVGMFISFGGEGIRTAVERMVEYVEYGAESTFFDDSVFWGGNVGIIVNFCREWMKVRKIAEKAETQQVVLFGRTVDREKIIDLQWGAQFTVDLLASRHNPDEAGFMLDIMKEAGCTYIYIGIESMAEAVIANVHKNMNKRELWDVRVRRALGLARQAGIRVGSSVLFGLEGETSETISETIMKVEELLAEDLLSIASPNILTYHPNTEITHTHRMEEKLDYHSANLDNRPPYSYFEEAFPAVVSKYLDEETIWNIHRQTQQHWGGKRNQNPMSPTEVD
ncbi:MAG: radical SAM protein [Chloroflexi bacterium]|nr:radical SAM protein [Chloroflexota bacterium]